MTRLTAAVADRDEGRRLKGFVRGTLGVSGTQFTALKFSGGLYVNGVQGYANTVLHAGDIVEVCLRDVPERVKAVVPEEGEMHIVYEDDQLLILDKPAGIACQSSDRNPGGTLENRLAWYYRAEPDFLFRPINRLDRGTSGLMAAAKTAHAAQRLQRLLHTDDFVREYLAVAEGRICGEGVWDAPIAKEDAASVRRVIAADGRPAVTHWRAEAYGNGRTLLRLRLETGRTHQIRVHASAAGHPLTGDFLYGEETDALPGRTALHSARLRLRHPITNDTMEWMSPLPEELAGLLKENG